MEARYRRAMAAGGCRRALLLRYHLGDSFCQGIAALSPGKISIKGALEILAQTGAPKYRLGSLLDERWDGSDDGASSTPRKVCIAFRHPVVVLHMRGDTDWRCSVERLEPRNRSERAFAYRTATRDQTAVADRKGPWAPWA